MRGLNVFKNIGWVALPFWIINTIRKLSNYQRISQIIL